MLLDARNTSEVPSENTAHTVIVGAGAAGLFLGILLARNKVNVTVLKAGDRVADSERKVATTSGRIHAGTRLGRAFGLGGTTTLWGGQLAEFEASDLSVRGREWPISFGELRQLYKQVYEFFRLSPLADEAYRQMLGNEQTEHGDGNVGRFFTHWLRQPNFAALFKTEILNNQNLTVMLNASACDIVFADAEAKSVVALTPGGRTITIGASNFVFACGTIENSRFFLSSERVSSVPWRGNKNIGAFFQDHIGGKVGTVQITDEKKFREFFENGFAVGNKLQPKLRFTSKGRLRSPIGIAGAFNFQSELTSSIRNVQGLVRAVSSGVSYSSYRSLPKDIWKLGRTLIPIAVRYAKDKRIMALYDRAPEFHVQCDKIPLAESCIRLTAAGRKSDGLFDAEVCWKVDGGEILGIATFCSDVDLYLRKANIARLLVDEDISRKDVDALERLQDTYHHIGGTCMSYSREFGVVDHECRVWDTRNVFVAGASVFPSSSHANCTLTALALALRLASRIISE